MSLILASSSPRRSQLLSQLGIAFTVAEPAIDEQQLAGESAEVYVRRMAHEKALNVAPRFPGDWILAADTIGEIEGKVLVKPDSRDHAAEMLRRLSGQTHQVLTAFCLLRGKDCNEVLSRTEVTFRVLSEQEILAYCHTGEGLDKAGAYAIQGRAAAFVAAIRGCYTTVVGLPLAKLAALLNERGFHPWQDRLHE